MALTRRSRGGLERAILEVLTAGGQPMTPAQVRDALDPGLAYTTVMTVLARLYDKAMVTRGAAGRGYAYAAVRDPSEMTARRMQHLLDGDPDRSQVLSRFVNTLGPSDERILRALLDDEEKP